MSSPAPQKILLVITKSNWGGAQHYVYTLAKNFHDQGKEVVVALGGTGALGAEAGVLASRLSGDGIRTIFLSGLTRDVSIVREWKAFTELLAVIKKEQPEVLHLNSSKVGGLGALAGRIALVPHIVFTAHGWAHREPRSPLKRLIIWLVSWFTILLSQRVIVVSKLDYDTAPVFFSHRKLRRVYNGIGDFPLLSKEDARAEFKKLVPALPTEGTWIVSNGELNANKSIDTAIAAFAKISTEYPLTSLVLIGSGEKEPFLRSLVQTLNLEQRVFFMGFIPDAKRYLLAADIFVLPSRKEGFPFVLLEAGKAALPVIASRTGGIPELITPHKTGLLIPPGNTDALAAALTLLLDDAALRSSLAHTLHTRVEEDFSEAKMISETLRAYT